MKKNKAYASKDPGNPWLYLVDELVVRSLKVYEIKVALHFVAYF